MSQSSGPSGAQRRRRLLLASRRWAVRLGFSVGRTLPLQRRVVLATAHDRFLRGNLAAIRDGLGSQHPPVPMVVVTRRGGGGIGHLLHAAWADVAAGYRLARSRLFVVDDYYFPIYVITPRQGTTIVQTWHAAGAFKKFGYSVLEKSFGADDVLVGSVPIHANYTICLVSSRATAGYYAEAFGVPLDDRFRSDLGLPRTDALLDDVTREATSAAVRAKYRIPIGRRVILYAPTFRGDSVLRAAAGPMLDLRSMRDRLGDDHVLLLRLHPFVRAGVTIPTELSSFAIDVSDHAEINDLLLASDVLVTDYSSVIFEYALLRRPMVFFAPDLDDYEGERGFYFDYRSGVPGPVFETTDAVADHLRAGTFDLERIDAFRARSFDVADGHATERFVRSIVLPVIAGDRPR